MNDPLTAYCFKCREKRPIKAPEAVFNKRRSPATRGVCPICGTTLYRQGRTAAHAELSPPKPKPTPRKGNLVIVESPAKARTIGRFLGQDYQVMASVGHVRDLLRSRLSVDVEKDFEPEYRVPNEKRKVVKEIAAAVKKAQTVYLATDLDREGEAIAWHLIESTGIEANRAQRVVFHEITPDAIAKSFANPGKLNMDLVAAQQARRILDRLVGYQISPLLWSRVRNRLTAGRVQSVTVRLVVEREREIEAFVPEEYWTLDAELEKAGSHAAVKSNRPFRAKLHRINKEPVELASQGDVEPILTALENGCFQVNQVRKGQRKRKPHPPFTTSTLQQTASGRLKFRAQRTMRVAQQLYEGVELDDGESVGLITYMRTDSVFVSEQAQQETRDWVIEKYGKTYLPSSPPRYKTKSKGAQEAHEAIRPTSVLREPLRIKPFLSRDQFRLYELIWQRFVGSQMSPAIYNTQSVDIMAGPTMENLPYLFRATGASLAFPGYLVIYPEKSEKDEGELPPLEKGERLNLVRLLPEQHFTQPPPRYTEASLVQALEDYGIGRPSTYAPILSTIQQRGYVTLGDKTGRALHPTETGILVNDLLVEHFPDVLSLDFTAVMEANLDEVAAGKKDWISIMRDFYGPFSRQLVAAEKNMPHLQIENEPVGRDCPECNNPLIIRFGRYGKFIACSNYPDCKHSEPWLDKIGVICPQCGGDLVRKRTRKGRPFYGCAAYPECDFTSWKQPIPHPCPSCKGLMVIQKKGIAQCTDCNEQMPWQE